MASADVFEKWRAAHQEAAAAVQELSRKSVRALEGAGEPPSREEAEQLRRLRSEADQEFEAAMACIVQAVSGRAQPAERRR